MSVLETHIVPANVDAARLSDYCAGIFESIPSRKGMKKAIKRGEVTVDGRTAGTGLRVKPGMSIELHSSARFTGRTLPLELEVIHIDPHLAVVFKPGGIPVSGNRFRTLENALPHNISRTDQDDALPRPLPAHRLDAPTCGLVLVARTRSALRTLKDLFEQNGIEKRYRALLMGKVPASAMINLPVEGKRAVTKFKTLERVSSLKNGHLSLVEIEPLTGRTHQIRRHAAWMGHAVLGDKLYSPDGCVFRGEGLFLCATRLRFPHPVTGDLLDIGIHPPPKFARRLQREQRMFERKTQT